MIDWFGAWKPALGVDVPTVAARFAAAIGCGLVVAAIHRGTRGRQAATSFPGTLVLLCVLIAMVAQVIGENVALAFSLVGALSIVRFRTVVRDTKDTAFVIFAVAVGMAVGTGQAVVAVGGIAAAGAVAWLFREDSGTHAGGARAFELDVRLETAAAPTAEPLVAAAISRRAGVMEPTACRSTKKAATLALAYRIALPPDTDLRGLVTDLRAIEGVQGIDLWRATEDA